MGFQIHWKRHAMHAMYSSFVGVYHLSDLKKKHKKYTQ